MWTALAMTAALAYVPAEQGELTLSHVRPTYGFLGATRKDADDMKLLPGDMIFISFDIENLKVAADGEGQYSMSMELTKKGGVKPLFKREPEESKALNGLGGSRVPAFVVSEIGTDTPPGEYAITAIVSDRSTKVTKKVTRKFEVLAKTFGLVRLSLSHDPRGQLPASPIAVPGQTIFVNFFATGFERDKKTKNPNIVASLRVLDDGKPVLEKPLTGSVDMFAEGETLIPLTFALPLNRTGKFTVELKITDKVAEKSVTQTFDLNIIEPK